MTHTQANDGPRLLLAALCRGNVSMTPGRTTLYVRVLDRGGIVVSTHALPLADDGTPILGEGLTQTLVKLMEEKTICKTP